MKTSNKLLLSAIMLTLVSLGIYDLALQKSYFKGDYKQPFSQFVALPFRDFNAIDLGASTAANIIVKQGPYNVRVDPSAAEFVKVSQTGQTLHIEVAFKESYDNIRSDYALVITCPTLVKINADARYTEGKKTVTDTLASGDFTWRPSIISGFTLDTLSIVEDHAGSIVLSNNKIRSVKAVLGLNAGSRSNMIIASDNVIQNADLDVLNNSQLQLRIANIPNLKYHLADSAKLVLLGAAQNLLKH